MQRSRISVVKIWILFLTKVFKGIMTLDRFQYTIRVQLPIIKAYECPCSPSHLKMGSCKQHFFTILKVRLLQMTGAFIYALHCHTLWLKQCRPCCYVRYNINRLMPNMWCLCQSTARQSVLVDWLCILVHRNPTPHKRKDNGDSKRNKQSFQYLDQRQYKSYSIFDRATKWPGLFTLVWLPCLRIQDVCCFFIASGSKTCQTP